MNGSPPATVPTEKELVKPETQTTPSKVWRAVQDPSALWLGGIALLLIVLMVGVIASHPDPAAMSSREFGNVKGWAVAIIIVLVIGWFFNLVRILEAPMAPDSDQALSYILFEECRSMAAYALQRGKHLDARDVFAVEDARRVYNKWSADGAVGEPFSHAILLNLNATHGRLAKLVAPAMPKTLHLLDPEYDSNGQPIQSAFPWLGRIRLVRMMIVLVVLLVPVFVGLAVDAGTRLDSASGLFEGNFLEKSQTALYLIVAASLGAAFAALTKAFRYIGNLSYDDKYEPSYWVRFVLGVVAGMILSVVLSQAFVFNGSSSASGSGNQSATMLVTIPLLALVGGFSSDLVYRILTRVVEALETLVKGSANDRVEAMQQDIEATVRTREFENRRRLAVEVIRFSQEFDPGSSGKAACERILQDVLRMDDDEAAINPGPKSGAESKAVGQPA